MGMWYAIIISALVIAGLGVIYLSICLGKFEGIIKLSKGKRWAKFLISLGIVLGSVALFAVIFSVVNAVIMLLIVTGFFLLYGLIFYIIKRIRKKDFKVNIRGWAALGTAAVYFFIGYILCHGVWQTDYDLSTNKTVGDIKIALIADSHMGATFGGEGFEKHLKTIEEQKPTSCSRVIRTEASCSR